MENRLNPSSIFQSLDIFVLVIFKTAFSFLLSSILFFIDVFINVLFIPSVPVAGIYPNFFCSQLWLNILASLPPSFFISSWQHHSKGELKGKLEILFTSRLCTECPSYAVSQRSSQWEHAAATDSSFLCRSQHILQGQLVFSIAVVLLCKGGLEQIDTGRDSLYHICISNLISYSSLLIALFIPEVNPDPFPSNM